MYLVINGRPSALNHVRTYADLESGIFHSRLGRHPKLRSQELYHKSYGT